MPNGKTNTRRQHPEPTPGPGPGRAGPGRAAPRKGEPGAIRRATRPPSPAKGTCVVARRERARVELLPHPTPLAVLGHLRRHNPHNSTHNSATSNNNLPRRPQQTPFKSMLPCSPCCRLVLVSSPPPDRPPSV